MAATEASHRMVDVEEATLVIVRHALDTPDSRLRLANAEGSIIGELERNRFNTERAIEIYKIAIDNCVWAWVKNITLGRSIYADYRRTKLGKKLAIQLSGEFKAKFNPPLIDQRPPRRFLRFLLGA